MLCGFNDLLPTIDRIFEYQKSKDIPQMLHFVPEEMIKSDSGIEKKYNISEDRDHFEYVHLLENLKSYASLEENHHVHRNYRYFKKHFPNVEIKNLDLSNKNTQSALTHVF